ncbi:MAG TPA: N-6 DNA methylase, partial [Chloroflexota bacterium]|nr:N-6 DNA methylase [Chloroflexota bacterium]
MKLLEAYIRELRLIRASGAGVPETSYYVPLAELLNAVGQTLRPKVRCIMTLKNQGAGLPDGGLFTPDQFQRGDGALIPGKIPSRGVIEIKPAGDDAWLTAAGSQVSKYWDKYRQVLVTNYRDFVLVGQDGEGRPTIKESFRLAESEAAFWSAAAQAGKLAAAKGASFEEFLKRVMLHSAPLVTPQDVAWFLASYAREAKARVDLAGSDALATVRAALEEGLGMKFHGRKGEHFFRSSLVQTLFYGVFSAWVLWSKQHPTGVRGATFNWQTSAHYLKVPVLRKLFYEVAEPGQLETLNLPEVLDWAGEVLNRVDRDSFFARFEEDHAVQYFYEPFLEAYDPELRKELGVWYTPPEIVHYMVERVDTVLRQDLGIEDGLADSKVYVLDPCCGTGAYLVEVLRKIEATLRDKRGDALVAGDVRDAAKTRVFGFEIMPAPFVVSHLQLGLLLQTLGAPLSEERRERPAVFLTNALTGWEPPEGPKQRFLFPEFEFEREAADRIKQSVPILVVLGNPPYNGFAGTEVKEEHDITRPYRTTKRAPAPQGQGLNDLYVRFFRMAEHRIVEHSGRGVVCFISNYSWLDGLSYTGMRERYLDAFDHIWIDCLNGDKYKTGKLTPEGEPDPSAFSTAANPEGIQVGTAISLLVRRDNHEAAEIVRFRHLWGRTKRAQLIETARQEGTDLCATLQPPVALGMPFVPTQVESSYMSWPLLPELLPVFSPGVKTSHDLDLIDIDLPRLRERLQVYFDSGVSDETVRQVAPSLM